MYNIIVIGAVGSTKITLEKLMKYQFNVVGVLGHEPINVDNVSGWVDLKAIAVKNEIGYKGFKRINAIENIQWAKEKQPDIIFAVGFSQLMSNEWLNMPTLGCVGFHPTLLPKGRGRAPIAWLTLEASIGAANFFLMGKGADDGPIFIQEEFQIIESDNAEAVIVKNSIAMKKALDKWLPNLKKGIWNPLPQNDAEASWYGKRAMEDGNINWSNSAYYIDRLIKATSKPYPGAYTYYKDQKVIIWESKLETTIPIKGIIGRILKTDNKKGHLIQCGDGLLWINKLSLNNREIKVGEKLGYNIEDELYKINKILKKLIDE